MFELMGQAPARWRVILGRVGSALFVVGIVALINGVMMRPYDPEERQIQDFLLRGGSLLSLAGYIASLVSMRVRPIVYCTMGGVAAAIFVPGLQRTNPAGSEMGAQGKLRAINSAQSSYSSYCAGGGYAVDLADLARAPANSSAGFVSPDLDHNGVVAGSYIITVSRENSPASPM